MFKWGEVLGFAICEPHYLITESQLELPQPEKQ
jgi:hypothetical protein